MPMHLAPLWDYLKQEIFPLASSEILWNPYHGIDPTLDQPQADKTRQANLKNYLASFPHSPKILLLGEAPGPWGCRFSGIAFTSERQLAHQALPFNGEPTSIYDPPVAERSATTVWGTLAAHHPDFFLWNTLPFHPHHPDKPLTIRTPKTQEIKQFLPYLDRIIELINPEQILAIGRKAEQGLNKLERPCTYIRHPSFGGTKRFQDGVHQFFT